MDELLAKVVEMDFEVGDTPNDLVNLTLRVNKFVILLVTRLPEIARLDRVVDAALAIVVKP